MRRVRAETDRAVRDIARCANVAPTSKPQCVRAAFAPATDTMLAARGLHR